MDVGVFVDMNIVLLVGNADVAVILANITVVGVAFLLVADVVSVARAFFS